MSAIVLSGARAVSVKVYQSLFVLCKIILCKVTAPQAKCCSLYTLQVIHQLGLFYVKRMSAKNVGVLNLNILIYHQNF